MNSLLPLQAKLSTRSHRVDFTSKSFNCWDILSTELWVMILEPLCVERRPFARKSYYLRLVSKRLNAIATPIIYRNFNLCNKLVASRPDLVSSRISAMLKAYTRQIFVFYNDDLNVYRVTKFLTDCKALRDLSWTFYSNNVALRVPLPIQLALSRELIQVRLRLKIYDSFRRGRVFELESIPAANLSALKMWDVMELDRGGDKFNALVVASKQLEVLRIPSYIHFSTLHGKLPAIKKLVIRDDWPYGPEAVAKIFDFSQLTTLVLEGEVDISSFVESVRNITFCTLKKLKVSEDGLFGEDDQSSSSAKLCDFISRLDQLQTVSVVTYDPTKVISALAIHQNSLTKLDISIPVEGKICFIGLKQARALVVGFPHLTELKISFNVPPPELEEQESYIVSFREFVKSSVDILAGLKYVRILCLGYVAHKAESLLCTEFASNIMKRLLARKNGFALEKLIISLERSFWDQENLPFEYSASYDWAASERFVNFEESSPARTVREDETSGEDSD